MKPSVFIDKTVLVNNGILFFINTQTEHVVDPFFQNDHWLWPVGFMWSIALVHRGYRMFETLQIMIIVIRKCVLPVTEYYQVWTVTSHTGYPLITLRPYWKSSSDFQNLNLQNAFPPFYIKILNEYRYILIIESLHNAVRTYTRTICPAAWFPFCIAWHAEKQQNMLLLLIDFIARFKISTECVF